jgi:hypothetical protein
VKEINPLFVLLVDTINTFNFERGVKNSIKKNSILLGLTVLAIGGQSSFLRQSLHIEAIQQLRVPTIPKNAIPL